MLVTLAYACLKLWMLWNKVFKTIGEVIDVVQGNAYGDLIVTIVEEPSYKKRMALAEPYLNKIAQVQLIRYAIAKGGVYKLRHFRKHTETE